MNAHRARRARREKETASEPLKRNREKKIDALALSTKANSCRSNEFMRREPNKMEGKYNKLPFNVLWEVGVEFVSPGNYSFAHVMMDGCAVWY